MLEDATEALDHAADELGKFSTMLYGKLDAAVRELSHARSSFNKAKKDAQEELDRAWDTMTAAREK